jgi:hypothetical protein
MRRVVTMNAKFTWPSGAAAAVSAAKYAVLLAAG